MKTNSNEGKDWVKETRTAHERNNMERGSVLMLITQVHYFNWKKKNMQI